MRATEPTVHLRFFLLFDREQPIAHPLHFIKRIILLLRWILYLSRHLERTTAVIADRQVFLYARSSIVFKYSSNFSVLQGY